MKELERSTTTNIANGDSRVGIQTGNVAGDVVHNEFHGNPHADTPRDKYDFGLHHLRTGKAEEARILIGEAVMRGYISTEVVFYYVLALVSDRVVDQLTDQDIAALNHAFELHINECDTWTESLRLVRRFLTYTRTSREGPSKEHKSELDLLMKEYSDLPTHQQSQIRRHMGLMLDSAIEDRWHHEDYQQICETRTANRRDERAWKFFHPDPAKPWICPPLDRTPDIRTWLRFATGSAMTLLSALWLIDILVEHPEAFSLGAVITMLSGTSLVVYFGLRWCRLYDQRHDKDLMYGRAYRPGARRPPTGNFAISVTRMFEKYARRYAPTKPGRGAWLEETEGVRRWLRDEIVAAYEGIAIPAPRVEWLIRYRVRLLEKQWQEGALRAYRVELNVPTTNRAAAITGGVMLIAGSLWTSSLAIRSEPLQGLVAVMLCICSVAPTARTVATMLRHQWLYQVRTSEVNERLRLEYLEYAKWRTLLADRPADSEMADWLDGDRRYLKHRVMRAYKLRPRDIIAHTFIDAPGKGSRKARDEHGAARYSRYQLWVYLLTTQGIRQVRADLDFGRATFEGDTRTSFRYEAVTSVEVASAMSGQRKVRLMLVNGEPAEVTVADDPMTLNSSDPSEVLARRTDESSGLDRTLRILEGIAAEGKDWLAQHQARRLNKLALFNQ